MSEIDKRAKRIDILESNAEGGRKPPKRERGAKRERQLTPEQQEFAELRKESEQIGAAAAQDAASGLERVKEAGADAAQVAEVANKGQQLQEETREGTPQLSEEDGGEVAKKVAEQIEKIKQLRQGAARQIEGDLNQLLRTWAGIPTATLKEAKLKASMVEVNNGVRELRNAKKGFSEEGVGVEQDRLAKIVTELRAKTEELVSSPAVLEQKRIEEEMRAVRIEDETRQEREKEATAARITAEIDALAEWSAAEVRAFDNNAEAIEKMIQGDDEKGAQLMERFKALRGSFDNLQRRSEELFKNLDPEKKETQDTLRTLEQMGDNLEEESKKFINEGYAYERSHDLSRTVVDMNATQFESEAPVEKARESSPEAQATLQELRTAIRLVDNTSKGLKGMTTTEVEEALHPDNGAEAGLLQTFNDLKVAADSLNNRARYLLKSRPADGAPATDSDAFKEKVAKIVEESQQLQKSATDFFSAFDAHKAKDAVPATPDSAAAVPTPEVAVAVSGAVVAAEAPEVKTNEQELHDLTAWCNETYKELEEITPKVNELSFLPKDGSPSLKVKLNSLKNKAVGLEAVSKTFLFNLSDKDAGERIKKFLERRDALAAEKEQFIREVSGSEQGAPAAAAPGKVESAKVEDWNSRLLKRGAELDAKAEKIGIVTVLRKMDQMYSKLSRREKLLLSALFFVGGIGAGAVTGVAGTALLTGLMVGKLAQRAFGAASLFVATEAKLQQRKEKKETWFNRHPRWMAGGMAALVVAGAPGLAMHEAGHLVGLGGWLGHFWPGHGGAGTPPHMENPAAASAAHEAAAAHSAGPVRVIGHATEVATAHDAGASVGGGVHGAAVAGPDTPATPEVAGPTPEAPGPHLIFEVKEGDNLWKFLESHYPKDSGILKGMGPEERVHAIANIEDHLRHLSPEDLKGMGFAAGNIDAAIHAGDHIDMSRVLEDKDFMSHLTEHGHNAAAEAVTPDAAGGAAGEHAAALDHSDAGGAGDAHEVASAHSGPAGIHEAGSGQVVTGVHEAAPGNVTDMPPVPEHILLQENSFGPLPSHETMALMQDQSFTRVLGDRMQGDLGKLFKFPGARNFYHSMENAPASPLLREVHAAGHGTPEHHLHTFLKDVAKRSGLTPRRASGLRAPESVREFFGRAHTAMLVKNLRRAA